MRGSSNDVIANSAVRLAQRMRGSSTAATDTIVARRISLRHGLITHSTLNEFTTTVETTRLPAVSAGEEAMVLVR